MVSWKEKEASIVALERNGKVDPLDLIAAARNKKHPCHDDFTWDVKQAAEERWRDQARVLIRRVRSEVTVEEVGQLVVSYVPTTSDETVFESLPKIRTTERVSDLLLSEVAMLLGYADRVYKIAISKWSLVGDDKVATLRKVRDLLVGLKNALSE
jgi:hypothetical protein